MKQVYPNVIHLANAPSIGHADEALQQIQLAVESWPDFAANAGVSELSRIALTAWTSGPRDDNAAARD